MSEDRPEIYVSTNMEHDLRYAGIGPRWDEFSDTNDEDTQDRQEAEQEELAIEAGELWARAAVRIAAELGYDAEAENTRDDSARSTQTSHPDYCRPVEDVIWQMAHDAISVGRDQGGVWTAWDRPA